MSRTDKTDPFRVKVEHLRRCDPYGVRRDTYGGLWRPEFRCGASCPTCGFEPSPGRKQRRAGTESVRRWRDEY